LGCCRFFQPGQEKKGASGNAEMLHDYSHLWFA
jgi:hypothetical protein